MSGIYIKGMEMPSSCRACMFSRTDIRGVDWCVLTEKDLPCDCPIVTVPTPHGGLVDKQRMAETNEQHHKIFEGEPEADYARQVVLRMLDQAPTIIEAEEEDEP